MVSLLFEYISCTPFLVSNFCDTVYKFSSRPLLQRPKNLHPLFLRSRGFSWRKIFPIQSLPVSNSLSVHTLYLHLGRYCRVATLFRLYVLHPLFFKLFFLLRSSTVHVLRLFFKFLFLFWSYSSYYFFPSSPCSLCYRYAPFQFPFLSTVHFFSHCCYCTYPDPVPDVRRTLNEFY